MLKCPPPPGVDRTLCCYHLDTFRVLGRYTEHQGYVNHLALVGVCQGPSGLGLSIGGCMRTFITPRTIFFSSDLSCVHHVYLHLLL